MTVEASGIGINAQEIIPMTAGVSGIGINT
jgi:hypothetical protein